MNDGKKSAYFGLFFIFMNTEETPLSSEGFGVQLDMSVVRGIFLVSCYDGFTRRNLVFKTHIST